MKSKQMLAGAALALVMAVGANGAQAANLIVNGSFETGDLTGWTSDSPFGLNPFGTTYGAGMDGTYWHWLSGLHEQQIITSQTVSGLSVGTAYTLSFIMASEFTASDQLRVSINGGAGTIFTAPPYNPAGFNGGFWTVWVPKTLSFVATATSETIQFDTVGLNGAAFDVGLDNVSLVAATVPEPGAWALMLVGLGGLGGALRARKGADRKLAA